MHKVICPIILSSLLLSGTAMAQVEIKCPKMLKLQVVPGELMPKPIPPLSGLPRPLFFEEDGEQYMILHSSVVCDVSQRLDTLDAYPAIATQIHNENLPDWKWPVVGGFVVGLGTAGLLVYLGGL